MTARTRLLLAFVLLLASFSRSWAAEDKSEWGFVDKSGGDPESRFGEGPVGDGDADAEATFAQGKCTQHPSMSFAFLPKDIASLINRTASPEGYPLVRIRLDGSDRDIPVSSITFQETGPPWVVQIDLDKDLTIEMAKASKIQVELVARISQTDGEKLVPSSTLISLPVRNRSAVFQRVARECFDTMH